MPTEVFVRPNCYFAARILFGEHHKLALRPKKVSICTDNVPSKKGQSSPFTVGYDTNEKKVVVRVPKKDECKCTATCVRVYTFPDFVLRNIQQVLRKQKGTDSLFTVYEFDKDGSPHKRQL